MRIASFDIGKKNFSFCVEDIDEKTLLSSKPPKIQYNPDGTCTEDMTTFLQEVYKNGKIVLHDNVNLTNGCDPKMKLDPLTFHNMIDVLNSHNKVWDKCNVFVIEEQMAFKGKFNPMAMKLGQHCYSYFAFRYGQTKEIIEFEAYHKTQLLGAPKTQKAGKNGKIRYKAMDKPARKKWSVEKAKEILELRDDKEGLKNLSAKKKRDDLADTLTQLQAYKIKYNSILETIVCFYNKIRNCYEYKLRNANIPSEVERVLIETKQYDIMHEGYLSYFLTSDTISIETFKIALKNCPTWKNILSFLIDQAQTKNKKAHIDFLRSLT